MNEQVRVLQRQQSNHVCFECGQSSPKWVSLNHGIFICEGCSELHSFLGVHISWLKRIDQPWSKQQLVYLKVGGNHAFQAFLDFYGLRDAPLPEKYYSKAAEHYRQLLRARVNGHELSYMPPTFAEGTQPFMPPPPVELTVMPPPTDKWSSTKGVLGSALTKASQLAGSSVGSVKSGAAKVYNSGWGLMSYLGKMTRAKPSEPEACPQPAGRFYSDVDDD